jgi:hypothetical protein
MLDRDSSLFLGGLRGALKHIHVSHSLEQATAAALR